MTDLYGGVRNARPTQWAAVIYAPNRWGPIKVFGPFSTMTELLAWRRTYRAGHLEVAPMWPGEAADDWPPVEPQDETERLSAWDILGIVDPGRMQ